MDTLIDAGTTEAVIRRHLQTFLEQRGIPAILADYHADACLYSAARVHRGHREIGEFFAAFITSLPPNAYARFSLGSLRVDGDLGFITWSIGDDIPLGTDTFVVRGGKIASQTFAMHANHRS
jgi:hypothetical protein